jgi:hypothetical protein
LRLTGATAVTPPPWQQIPQVSNGKGLWHSILAVSECYVEITLVLFPKSKLFNNFWSGFRLAEEFVKEHIFSSLFQNYV